MTAYGIRPYLDLLKPASLCFGFVLFLFFTTGVSALNSPWETGEGENVVTGIYQGTENNSISVVCGSAALQFTRAPQFIAAIMGNRYGRLVEPEDFPDGLQVELYITEQGTVRAMRNLPAKFTLPEGHVLPDWGHSASLSPSEEYYLIYNQLYDGQSCLFLQSPTMSEPPLILSDSPVAAWTKSGSKVASPRGNTLLVFDTLTKEKSEIPLGAAAHASNLHDSVLIITDLAWNDNEDRLFYTSLQDEPDLGSDLFLLTICDSRGEKLAVKTVPCLGTAAWLPNDLILYTAFDSFELNTGKVLLWDYRLGQTSVLLPEKEGGYHNICLNKEGEKLAYTIAGQVSENLYVMDIKKGVSQKIISLPYPIRNLQWSGRNTLLYWDQMNNLIYEIKETKQSGQPAARANGFLPLKSVSNNLIYFLSEPWEEPQQPYLLPLE